VGVLLGRRGLVTAAEAWGGVEGKRRRWVRRRKEEARRRRGRVVWEGWGERDLVFFLAIFWLPSSSLHK
jgi:hypothetical protein